MTLITLEEYQQKRQDARAGKTGVACPQCDCELMIVLKDSWIPDAQGFPGRNVTCSSDACGFKTVITL